MIIGTAGHIDHGKSALVTALTGRPVDRLAEERRRGITIDLNFAPLRFPGLAPIGMIDVPGHEDLIRTMVAGATGIDLVLLVIDLVEGPRPQTEEHLAILEQLRIPAGIPVFTKADLADPEWAQMVVAETMTRLERSGIGFEAPAVVSALTGQGIDALLGRLEDRARRLTTAVEPDLFRMPVDRVFSVAGIGTVVTGTAWTGRVAVGDSVTVGPGERTARVRSVEAYGFPAAATEPHTRTALGLTGLDKGDVGRGDQILTGRWRDGAMLDVLLELLPSAAAPLGARSRVRLHLGTAELMARAYPRGPLKPGERGLARLVLERPTVARAGDRFVVRSYSPVATIGGGEVIDPLPPRRPHWSELLSSPDPRVRLSAVAKRHPEGLDTEILHQFAGCPPEGAARLAREAGLVPVAERWHSPDRLEALEAEAIAAVDLYHRTAPTEPGLSTETIRQRLRAGPDVAEHVLRTLQGKKRLRIKDGIATRPDFAPPEQGIARLEELLERLGLELPTADDIALALDVNPIWPLLRRAVDAGTVQAVDRERYASRGALDRFRAALIEVGARGDITPAALRERLGLSRKFLIPLLEWADRQGLTRRVGDARVLVQSGRP